jgi:hypothetical protein
MHTTTPEPPHEQAAADPVEAARVAIWRLFEEGYVDEDMATAGLLAVDVGTRRRPHEPTVTAKATAAAVARPKHLHAA